MLLDYDANAKFQEADSNRPGAGLVAEGEGEGLEEVSLLLFYMTVCLWGSQRGEWEHQHVWQQHGFTNSEPDLAVWK